jgi:pilus assembly protein Flp/PilA
MPLIPAIYFYGCFTAAGYIPSMAGNFRAFLKDKSAATAIEYGLIAAGIAVAIISVTKGLGVKLNTTFTSVSSALK